jgi:hypothetical protein
VLRLWRRLCQVREMTASVRTLDVFGFVRDDCVNPMVPAACPSHSTRIVRDENSMYQLTRFTPPITAFLPSCRYASMQLLSEVSV